MTWFHMTGLYCLKLFDVHEKLVTSCNETVEIVLMCNNEVLGIININWGIFQGDTYMTGLYCLKLFDVHEKLVTSCNETVEIVLMCNNEVLGIININWGIFQGDTLLPLLFVLSLMPLSIVLRNINKGYVVHKDLQKVNHCCI